MYLVCRDMVIEIWQNNNWLTVGSWVMLVLYVLFFNNEMQLSHALTAPLLGHYNTGLGTSYFGEHG